MWIPQARFYKVHLLEQRGLLVVDSRNVRSPHLIMWRGRVLDILSKTFDKFALSLFLKLLLDRETLLSSLQNIFEIGD